MIEPSDLKLRRPIEIYNQVATTTEVWAALRAAHDGNLPALEELGERNAELLVCQYDYTTPMHLAVREGRLAVVKYLVAHRALDPAARNHPFLESLYTIAADRGHLEVLEALEAAAKDPTSVRTLADTGKIHRGESDRSRRFQKAIHDGRVAEVEAILKDHPAEALNPDAFWGEGVMAVAAKVGNRPMLELLLRYGAQVPSMSKWGARYYFKRLDMATFLLENGMSARHMHWRGFTLLHDMAFAGDVAKGRLLLDHGADIDAIDGEYESTPLGYAAHFGHLEFARFLIDRGADVEGAGAPWATPLAWTRRRHRSDLGAALTAAGARR